MSVPCKIMCLVLQAVQRSSNVDVIFRSLLKGGADGRKLIMKWTCVIKEVHDLLGTKQKQRVIFFFFFSDEVKAVWLQGSNSN